MIKLTRIDDRLLHGQVALTWVPSVSTDCIMIANDKVANDEFTKMSLNLAKPTGIKLLIKTIKDAITFLNDERTQALKILVLINSIQDAFILTENISEIKSINLGGIRIKEGAKLISKAIAVTEADIQTAKQMLNNGIELEIRQVPTEQKMYLKNLI